MKRAAHLFHIKFVVNWVQPLLPQFSANSFGGGVLLLNIVKDNMALCASVTKPDKVLRVVGDLQDNLVCRVPFCGYYGDVLHDFRILTSLFDRTKDCLVCFYL